MWIWVERFRAHARLGREISLWYHPEYAAHELGMDNRIPNVLLDRGERVLDRLTERGILRLADVRAPNLAAIEELGWVHTAAYLDASLEPETLAHIFGVPPDLIDVDVMVQAQRRAVGGTIAAALQVTRGETKLAFNLGGGFHHAEPAKGSGFSIYNDVAVAIARVRRDGYVKPIAIIDLDFHQGNGNLVAFADDPTVLTYSLHGAEWIDMTAVASVNVQLPPRTSDGDYMRALRRTLPKALTEHAPGLVIYVAGNDVLAGDNLGDFVLSPRGVLDRDLYVTRLTRDIGAGMVVVMAGGYSGFAWQATSSYLRWLLTDRIRAPRYPDAPLRRRFRQISRGMGASELQRDDELSFSEEDIIGDLGGRGRPRLVLGYYTRQGIELALERFGFLRELRDRGFEDLRIEITGLDVYVPALRVYGRALGEGAELLLVELIVRRKTIDAPPDLGKPPTIDTLMIEWLLLQNPTKHFVPGRPKLPGQSHPGLGLAGQMQELMIRVVARLRLEGLLSRPSHYHNAALAGPAYQFIDARVEGRYRAMRRALSHLTIPEATRLVDEGRLRTADGEVVSWEPGDQLLPYSTRLKNYFDSEVFQSRARAEMEALDAEGLHLV